MYKEVVATSYIHIECNGVVGFIEILLEVMWTLVDCVYFNVLHNLIAVKCDCLRSVVSKVLANVMQRVVFTDAGNLTAS